jgi:SprT-like family.
MDFVDPARETYRGFYAAFDHFNAALFDGALPDVMITMQRQRGARGYFSSDRFGYRRADGIVVDEIALNPVTFTKQTDREIISTLVHEMVHQWQHHFGKPGRGTYHNKQWTAKMVELGLMPYAYDTGKQTGQRVTHYIVDGGPFDRAWQQLAASGYTLDYQDPARSELARLTS